MRVAVTGAYGFSGRYMARQTYWVRFDHPPHFTFAQALANAKVLFDAAKRAGVRRVVHISITNPDRKSDLSYFSGKSKMEDYLKHTGLPTAFAQMPVRQSGTWIVEARSAV